MGTSHRIRNMAFGPPSIGKPKSTPHGPRPSLQDSDEAQLRACLGLPARALAVLGDIDRVGPARYTCGTQRQIWSYNCNYNSI